MLGKHLDLWFMLCPHVLPQPTSTTSLSKVRVSTPVLQCPFKETVGLYSPQTQAWGHLGRISDFGAMASVLNGEWDGTNLGWTLHWGFANPLLIGKR